MKRRKKTGRNINGIDLQSSLSYIRDAGRNHTISVHCTTPMSFRSIEIDPFTKGLGLSGHVPTVRAHCLVLHFHHNAFWMQDTVSQLQMTFILHSTQSRTTLVFTVCSQCVCTFHSQAAVILFWNHYGSAKCVCVCVRVCADGDCMEMPAGANAVIQVN